ncbi:hypothetical protein V527_27645 [Pseudomonas aeruginosa VRFPA06]|nr:hypothetical protein V527_27645 [Pseudomonas aeruginosa VRFPA06]
MPVAAQTGAGERRGLRLRPQPDAQPTGQRAGGHVDEMVLPGGQHRQPDQREPAMQQPAPGAAGVARVADPEHYQQGDVQRRCLVVRFVEPHQHVEQPAEHAAQFRPFEGEAQGEQQEAGHRQHLGAEQAQAVGVQLALVPRQQQRQAVEQVDRPVRQDGPGPQRHPAFPVEDQAADVAALAGQPVGQAIAGEEERAEEQQPEHRPLQYPRLARRHQRATFCASDTLKMPHWSTRWVILRKPAAATSWSISAWVRRRITQAWPWRWLVSARAISSSCGCQGCPV